MVALKNEFNRKIDYHRQKAYHDPAEIYWIAHEFLTAILKRGERHHTEEELGSLLKDLKHDFITLPVELIDAWQVFLAQLAYAQYGGYSTEPRHVQLLLEQCALLIEETLREVIIAPDELTKQLQALKVLVQNGEVARAEHAYRTIIKAYERLPNDRKQGHYHRVASAFNTISASRNTPQA